MRIARSDSSSGMSARARSSVPSTVSPGVNASDWATYSMRRERRPDTTPASGFSCPARIFSSVDFPAPFGPIKPVRSPSSIPSVIPLNNGREPYDLLIS
jgi:hypothetical protein